MPETGSETEGRYSLLRHKEADGDFEETELFRSNATRYARPSVSLIVIIIFFVEIANVVFYASWHFILAPWTTRTEPEGLPLSYNATRIFTANISDLSLVHASPEADSYWSSITKGANNGLVSLPMDITLTQGLEHSGLNTTPGQGVFQIDAFHQLHCVARVREMLLSFPSLLKLNPNLSEQDRYYAHTLHCVDYLRQSVMCNADLTLVSTGKDLEFDHGPPRQCRDWDAVVEWVDRWKWIPDGAEETN
ncbi:MAG: hypothetical protein M1820_005532 [Bogoriella megaspora]|nr:MAG: hypothetical protein M1820_005532 [Bogoriella megaspora]